MEDFFGGWGDDDDEEEDDFDDGSGETLPGTVSKGSGSILQPSETMANKRVPGRRIARTPQKRQSRTKPKPKTGLSLSLRNEGPQKDLMDDSWGQDNTDLEDLLGGFSSPEQSPKAQKPSRSMKVTTTTTQKKKKKNTSMSTMKAKQSKTKPKTKAKTTTALKIVSKPKKSQDNLFEEFGF